VVLPGVIEPVSRLKNPVLSADSDDGTAGGETGLVSADPSPCNEPGIEGGSGGLLDPFNAPISTLCGLISSSAIVSFARIEFSFADHLRHPTSLVLLEDRESASSSISLLAVTSWKLDLAREREVSVSACARWADWRRAAYVN
jgi:hypothetical protein